MLRYFDITLTITPSLPVWPGDPAVQVERVSSMEEGESVNVTRLNLSAHTGTHVDAPFHFIHGGGTVEQIPLEALIGECEVVQVPDDVDSITAEVIRSVGLPQDTQRILFKTRNSGLWHTQGNEFQRDFVAIEECGAKLLVEMGVKLVGIDYLSVSPFEDVFPTHLALLRAGIVALEGLDLSLVAPGRYTLFCLPLKIGGSDGAPARVILIGV